MTENLAGIRGAAPVGLVQDLTPDEALQYILSLQELHIKKVEKRVAKGLRSKVQLLTLLKEHAETLSRAAALPFALEQVRAQRHELQVQGERDRGEAESHFCINSASQIEGKLERNFVAIANPTIFVGTVFNLCACWWRNKSDKFYVGKCLG